jgi:SAM-dependent methyltransferase
MRASRNATVPPDYFRRLYREYEDPWNFATSPYEHAKYEATLAVLPRERYRSALELGCSVGVFTRMLATRCDILLAVDVSLDALARATRRCRDIPRVRFAPCDLATGFPRGDYELITLCELGFYFSPRDLARIKEGIATTLTPGGDLVLVHWTPPVDGHAQTAAEVHETFLEDPRFRAHTATQARTYRIDVLTRV